MIDDGRALRDGAILEADTCIVGAGPAGLTLAVELGAAGIDTLLVESGGLVSDPDIAALNDGVVTGEPLADLRTSRHRQVGGTAWMWNTYLDGVAGAKYSLLDPIDFEARAWVPGSGWPFDRAHLEPFYAHAHERLGLGGLDYAAATWSGDAPLLPLDGTGIDSAVYRIGPATLFTGAGLAGVRLVHGVTVTGLDLDAAGERVVGARWATRRGTAGTVRARRFVLTLGGIENARLLLLSAAEPERVPGNRHGWVGRGFMEHPRDASLRLVLRRPEPRRHSAFYLPHRAAGGQGVWGRLALSSELLRSERLLNASVVLAPEVEHHRGWPQAVGRLARRLLVRAPRVTAYRVEIHLEQAMDPGNRIRLAETRDPLGSPQPEVDWRWGDKDRANLERVSAIVAAALERTRKGRVERIGADFDPNAHHHAGTTRMHLDPHEGVVDAHGRVHGVENVWVCGSSTFPTAGFANPTLTIVALALRLAERLAGTPRVTNVARSQDDSARP